MSYVEPPISLRSNDDAFLSNNTITAVEIRPSTMVAALGDVK